VSQIVSILRDEIPQTKIIQGIITDITESVKTKEKLFEVEKRFGLLFNNAPIGITLTDKDGKMFYCNPKWEEIVGYKFEEMKNLTWMDITYKEDLKEDLEKFNKLIKGVINSYSLKKRLIRKDGEIIWINLKVVRVDDENGNFLYELALIEDITQEIILENKLKESERRFRLFFEKNPLGVAIVDKNNNYIAFNDVYKNLIGYSDEELKKINWKDITHPEDLPYQTELLEKLIKREIDSYNIEKRYIRKDGSIFWGQLFASAIFDENGEFLYSFGLLRDITEEKRLREEIEESREKLKRVIDNLLSLITKITEMKDPYTLGHQGKVAFLAEKVARKMNLDEEIV